MTDYGGILRVLTQAEVEFVIVGGLAATALGAARFTSDVDVVYRRTRQNLERLAVALKPHKPYLRNAPPGLPFTLDAETLKRGLNFTLICDLGSLDLLGEIAGGGTYGDILPSAVNLQLFGVECRVLDVDALIVTKRAAGRPKDFEAIAELEIIRDQRKKNQ